MLNYSPCLLSGLLAAGLWVNVGITIGKHFLTSCYAKIHLGGFGGNKSKQIPKTATPGCITFMLLFFPPPDFYSLFSPLGAFPSAGVKSTCIATEAAQIRPLVVLLFYISVRV